MADSTTLLWYDQPMKRIELLAPGGDVKSVKAAILAGADAVYLGVGELNARKRAVNIAPEDVKELCLLAHGKNCRIYLTLNVIIQEEEFPPLMELLSRMVESGIDGVIIQDYGLLYVTGRLFPSLELHGSTQMTSHNRGQLELLARSGVAQVNLSRELSLQELKELTGPAHRAGLKVEVFVHGAFCVSFSGQCYISGRVYSNSANRGACVQPCRRAYHNDSAYHGGSTGRVGTFSRNNELPPLRPLNLKDNSLFASAEELIDAGIDSLKIEGRIKGYDYVYNTISAWREQLDRIQRGETAMPGDPRLEGVFNRRFSDNLLKGRLGADSFSPDSSDASLKCFGRVAGYSAENRELSIVPAGEEANQRAFPGQIITIKDEDGSFICTGTLMEEKSQGVWFFRIDHRLMGKIRKGQEIRAQSRVTDLSLVEEQIHSMKAEEPKQPLRFRLTGRAGGALVLQGQWMDRQVEAVSTTALEAASGHPFSPKVVRKQLSRLGNTPFYLAECDTDGLEEGLFIPVSLLNELRREVVEGLIPNLSGTSELSRPATSPGLPRIIPASPPETQRIAVAVSLRSMDILGQIPRERGIIPLFEMPADPQVLAEAAEQIAREDGIIPWFPSILIGEQFDGACDVLLRSRAPFVVSDNMGIAFIAEQHRIPWVAGPMLNGSNGYALEFFHSHGAVGSFCSPELDLLRMQNLTIPRGIELWIPLAAPVFLMKSRHCLVRNCSPLENGSRGCGKEVMDRNCLPHCSRSAVISDSQGNSFLVVKNRGDYNSMYLDTPTFQPELLQEPRIGTVLLDFRAPHPGLLPQQPLGKLMEDTIRSLRSHRNHRSR